MTLAKDLKQWGAIAKSFLGDIESHKYTYEGQRCTYLVAGKGERIVLLHGSAVTKSYWRQIMQRLAPHYQLIALEVPGYNVDKPSYFGRFTFKHLSQWLTDTLVAIGVPEEECIHVTGYCSGAALAAYYTATHLPRVKTLTMISIPYVYIDPQMNTEERKLILESRWVESEADFYALLEKTFAEPPYIPAIAVRRYVKNMKDKRALFEQMVDDTCSSSALLVSKLSQISVPTLAMTGDRDSLSPIGHQQQLANTIPQVQQRIIDTCGHLSIVEQPEAIAEYIYTFLREH